MAFENVNQSYEYRDGDTESEYFNRNLQNQLTDPTFYMGGSIGQSYKGFSAKKKYKQKRKEFERNKRIEEANARDKAYRRYQTDIGRQRSADEEKRMGAITALEKGFADPSRTAARYELYQANLGNEVASLNRGFQDSSQRAAQEAVRRGRLGSSTDAEKQSALGHTLRSSVMGAENAANEQRTSIEDQDQRQLQSLRRSLLTADPQAQQTYRAQASQASGEVGRILSAGADQQRQREQEALEQMQRYQTYGGMANAGAAGVYGYFGNPQYGGAA